MSTGEGPARFEKICRDRLPDYLEIVRKRMDNPFPLSRIAVSGVGEKTALSMVVEAFGMPVSDFPGAYVLKYFIQGNTSDVKTGRVVSQAGVVSYHASERALYLLRQ